jgi:HEAT repeat protein
MLFSSLFSMALSLLSIVYSSMNLLSDVSGLKTSSEKYSYISNLLIGQEGGIESQMSPSGKDPEFCIKALDDENPEVRSLAAEALGQMRGSRAEEALFGLLEYNNSGVRITAVRARGRIGAECTVEPLIKSLVADKNPAFRTCVIEVLGNLKDKRAIEPL